VKLSAHFYAAGGRVNGPLVVTGGTVWVKASPRWITRPASNENAPDPSLSHAALVEQPLPREAISSAQLIPCPRFYHLYGSTPLSFPYLRS